MSDSSAQGDMNASASGGIGQILSSILGNNPAQAPEDEQDSSSSKEPTDNFDDITQMLQSVQDTSWFGQPPDTNVNPQLVQAATNGTDVTATSPTDPSKPAPSVVAANGGTAPSSSAVSIADTVGKSISSLAETLGINTNMMQQLFQQGKAAGAAVVADTLKQGQVSAAQATNESQIEQAKTADLASVNKLMGLDIGDPNSTISRAAATLNDAQNTATSLEQDLNEKAKIGFLDNPVQWFTNKITSIGEQSRLDDLNTNIVNAQTKLRNDAGLATDIGRTTAAADATGLVTKGQLAAQVAVTNAQKEADAANETAIRTNVSNLNTLNSQTIEQANLMINQSRLSMDAINTQQNVIRTQLEGEKAPLVRAQLEDRQAAITQRLQDDQASQAFIQTGAKVVGIDNAEKMTLPAFRALPKEQQMMITAAAQGHFGIIPGSPSSALDTFATLKTPNVAPPVADTVSKLRTLTAAITPQIQAAVAASTGKNIPLSALPPAQRDGYIDQGIFAKEQASIIAGPELDGPKGLYSMPSLATATNIPVLKDSKLPLMQSMKPLIDADTNRTYPVQAQDFLDAAYDLYKKDPTPDGLKKNAAQVTFAFQNMVANRNAVNNYAALGLMAPNGYNATVDTKYSKVPGFLTSKVKLDMTDPAQVEKFLMTRRLADQVPDISLGIAP